MWFVIHLDHLFIFFFSYYLNNPPTIAQGNGPGMGKKEPLQKILVITQVLAETKTVYNNAFNTDEGCLGVSTLHRMAKEATKVTQLVKSWNTHKVYALGAVVFLLQFFNSS